MSMALALEQYGPFTVAAGRAGIGAVALLAVVAATRPGDLAMRDPKILGFILLMGVLNFALPFGLLTWGLQRVPSAFAPIRIHMCEPEVGPLARKTSSRDIVIFTGRPALRDNTTATGSR